MQITPEKRALLFVSSIVLLGATVRFGAALRGSTESGQAGDGQLGAQIAAVDNARQSQERIATARKEGGTVDLDRAGPEELQSLPRIGPVLARRIVAHRDSVGGFGSMEAFLEVKGVGPAMAKALAPRVTFSSNRRPRSAASSGRAVPQKRPMPRTPKQK